MEAVLVGAIVLASLLLAYLAYQALMGSPRGVRRRFAKLPVTHVADAVSPGVYRFEGRVRAIGEVPVSQASGRAYVARDLRIVPFDGGDSAGTRSAQQAVDFLVDDGTGVALVRAGRAAVAIDRDFEAPRSTLDRLPWVDELLREGGYVNGSPETCRIRLYEGVLSPGDPVGVIGQVEPADREARALGAAVVVSARAVAPGGDPPAV